MVELGGFIFDAQGLAERGPAGVRREWRGLAGVEVLPPVNAADAEWEVAFFFAGAPPAFLRSDARGENLATALRFAREAAPAWSVFSPRAQLLLEREPAAADPTPSLPAVRLRRAQRRTRAAWSLVQELRIDPADAAALRAEEIALAEESGRCPAKVLEAFEAALRQAPRDDAAFAAVTRLYLAIDHEFAASYAPRALPRDRDRLAVTTAYARWLARHERGGEAEELLRGAVARGGEPAPLQALTAQQLALRHHLAHPRRGRWVRRWVVGTVGIAAAIGLVGYVSLVGFKKLRGIVAPGAAPLPTDFGPGGAPHPDAFKDLPANDQPLVLEQQRPVYPPDLRLKNVEGQVLVDFTVDRVGIPRNVFAVRSTQPGFDAAAVAAVQHWRFRPGTKNGVPVNTHLQVPIVFTLSDESATGAAKK